MSAQQFEITKKKVTNNPNKWLFSFADLISLILTFFILIFSMAEPIQLTNQYVEQFNSPIAMQKDINNSKIKLAPDGIIDNEYIESIIRSKIANEEQMKKLNVKIIDKKLSIYAHKNTFKDTTIKAIYDTITPLSSATAIVAGSLIEARAVAYKLNKVGMTENLSYFEDKNLQNNIKIIVYPKF